MRPVLAVVPLGLGVMAACGGGGGSASGEPVPEVQVVGLADGESVDLAELGEGPVVVNLWATWCVPCRKEMPDFDRVDQAVDDADVRIVGVNIGDDADAAREFVDELAVGFPQYLDPDGGLHAELGATSMPSTAFIDEGRLVGLHTGVLTSDELADELEERFDVTVELDG